MCCRYSFPRFTSQYSKHSHRSAVQLAASLATGQPSKKGEGGPHVQAVNNLSLWSSVVGTAVNRMLSTCGPDRGHAHVKSVPAGVSSQMWLCAICLSCSKAAAKQQQQGSRAAAPAGACWWVHMTVQQQHSILVLHVPPGCDAALFAAELPFCLERQPPACCMRCKTHICWQQST